MKNIINKIKENYKLIITVLLVGSIIGFSIGKFTSKSNKVVPKQNEEASHKHETLAELWTCSMHPQIQMEEPGNCPICGMTLIPMENTSSKKEDADPAELSMSESAIKLADIETIIVKKGKPEKSILLLGKVKADERKIAQLTARFGGRIEKLLINYTGQNVKKGQKLGTIYSPDLITAQKELIEAIKYKETNPSFYLASRSKLKLWDLSEAQIDAIETKGEPKLYFDILSPISGTVTKRHVALGDYVKEGSALFEVTDLRHIWVMFDAYESDLPWIKVGDKIKLTLQSLPGKEFTTNVTFIDPFIDAKTRITQVRVELNNPNLNLKPEMFANGILESNFAKNTSQILIPKSAVLWTGKKGVVYVKVPNREMPTFLYREITLGAKTGNFYVVVKGLEEGEEIATNGVFKIDASSQLAGKPSMMNPSGGKISTGHNHGGKKMKDEEMAEMENTANKSYIENTPQKFKKQVGNLVNAYLKMKDAFVQSDEQSIENEAENTISALEMLDMKLLKGEAHIEWMNLLKPIKNNLKGIISMKGIEMKRSHFSIVSDKLTETIDKFGMKSSQTVYLEFCPMAFDKKGAFWISSKKEIQNPYFGEKMPNCGEVKKQF